MKETWQYKLFKYFNVTILIFIVFVTLFPFFNIVAQSFSSESYINSGQVSLWPKGFNVETYRVIMSDNMFWVNYKNTVVYTVVGTVISLVLSTMIAYPLSKKRLKGRRFLTLFFVFTMFFNGGLIPNYVLVTSLGFGNSIWAIVIPNAISVFNMLIMRTFFQNIPEELEEAAIMDGSSTFGILFKIVLPLSKPILATMMLFYAVAHWNSWFPAFIFFTEKELFPVSIYLRNMIKGAETAVGAGATSADNMVQISSNIKSVTMVLTVLPILMVYPYIQKYFVSGVMLGSVKG
ncbi:carbohydrate ABC transporter permease [Gracilibacillus alcaliphilus]|uniref:carbohydrate ABC transporter permease n=1 Tax=Gracilibacillus alcaliphilus TaxID=1401441 RepID=UPI00195AEA02|nr:carbohydrate ABC transporter permease [Gracilibacillus alcaliphilus]MBM7679579.1 putative aldouronate transport system permease protein [Gracilibacillus alcaliphilus]